MKILQITLCILSCVAVAASILVAVLVDWIYFFVLAAAAALFAFGMVIVKRKREPRVELPDYMNSDEENARINSDSQNDE